MVNTSPTLCVCVCVRAVTDPNTKQDDGVYDIITDEEVNGLYDSDTHSHTTAESQDGEAESPTTQEP